MRLTLRGVAVLAVVGLAVLAAVVSGQRSLNAVAAPLLGAVLFGAIQVWRADDPTITVGSVRPGYPGQSRPLEITFEGSGVARVTSDWPDGISGEPVDAALAMPTTLTEEIRLDSRGVHELGGLTVCQRDALGLVETPVAITNPTTVTVYPEVYHVGDQGALASLLADETHIERQEFDRLREYEPGDPLRRIHWTSSAKRDEFLVVEYAASHRTEQVTIAAEAVGGRADEMATAVGTIALLALQAGHDVAVDVPGEGIPAGSGEVHRANLLALLARADAGPLTDERREAADVIVDADHRVTRVTLGSTQFTVDDLLGETQVRPVREVASA